MRGKIMFTSFLFLVVVSDISGFVEAFSYFLTKCLVVVVVGFFFFCSLVKAFCNISVTELMFLTNFFKRHNFSLISPNIIQWQIN